MHYVSLGFKAEQIASILVSNLKFIHGIFETSDMSLNGQWHCKMLKYIIQQWNSIFYIMFNVFHYNWWYDEVIKIRG